MSGKAYKRKAGEFEIRILPDGRVVMLAPDEAMMEIGRAIEGQESRSQIRNSNLETLNESQISKSQIRNAGPCERGPCADSGRDSHTIDEKLPDCSTKQTDEGNDGRATEADRADGTDSAVER